MLRISIAIEEFMETGFTSIFSTQRAVLTKEEALKQLLVKYKKAKKFLEENWHNGS